MKHDAFTLEVFRNQVASVAEEMGTALQRTAFSPNIKERRDHSCAVFDPSGRLVAQAEHIPVHLGSMPGTVEAVLGRLELGPGDIAVLNDPFAGGTHLPDISMVSPVFVEGRLTALLASRAHHSDVGGLAPGSLAIATEVYQEGLVIPPVLIQSGGAWRRDIEDLILANTRNPGERAGDLAAQAAAHSTGEVRLSALAASTGAKAVQARFSDLMEYSEALARAAVSGLPDFRTCFTDYLDDDGLLERDMPVTVTVEVCGDSMTVDFEGSSHAVPGPLNCPRAVTLSATYYVYRCVTGSHIPANDGAFRPLEVRVPAGSMLAAECPHAVAGGNVETSQRVVDALLGALAGPLPGVIPAASYGTMSNLAIGSAPGSASQPFSYYETVAGGTGGHPRSRGSNGTQAHMTNTLNTPVEALEYAYPLRVRCYRIRRGSGGTGLHRGGDGLVREVEVLDRARVTILSDRRKRGPWGLAGGGSGRPGANVLERGGKNGRLPGKCTVDLEPGDVMRILTPGGGGWGGRPAKARRHSSPSGDEAPSG